jgi:hypothetical protein
VINKISCKVFYDHLKELNNVEFHNEENFNEVDIDQISSYNEDLFLPFTVNEIHQFSRL